MTAFGGGVMTAFVEECRQEWRRLGVPDGLAEEMATELESDLAEAEADGVSAAELLGESDPRRFAATWARERGLVSEPAPQKRRRRVWPWIVAAFVLVVFVLSWLALQTLGTDQASTASPVHVMPLLRRVSVPNVVGMNACKAARAVARTGVDDWRIAGHEHGYSCDEIVVAQSPLGHVVRRDGRPVIVTLRLGRS
jgi:hypothetical protein